MEMEVDLLQKCVICGDEYEENKKRRMVWESTDDSIKSKDGLHLKNQLSVMLLVRKILGLSHDVLRSMLRDHGNPSEWGLKMCGPCGRIFREVEFVHGRLSQLHLEYQELPSNLVEQLQKSQSQDKGYTMDKAKKSVRRRPKTRRRGRMRNVPIAVASLETSECIRQEFFKKNGNSFDATSRMENKDIITSSQESDHDAFSKIDSRGDRDVKPNLEQLRNNESIESINDDDDDPGVEDAPSPTLDESTNDSIDDNEFQPPASDKDDDADSDYEIPKTRQRGKPKKRVKFLITHEPTLPPPVFRPPTPPRERIDVFSIPQPIKRELDYECPLCSRTALCKSSCHGHILRHHYDDRLPFHCHLCEKQFKKETSLRTHLDVYHDVAKTALDDDDPDLEPRTPVLQKNQVVEANTNSRKYQCNLCTKTKYRVRYKSLESLEAHKKMVHMGIEKPYECNQCGKGFRSNAERRLHLYAHQRQERDKKARSKSSEVAYCSKCDRHFKSVYFLKLHLKTKPHLADSEYPFLCELCTKGFVTKQSFENHRARDHYAELNVKPFQCKYCSKILSCERSLDHHTRIKHTKLTLFNCDECNLGFMFRNGLKIHVAAVHKKVRPFLCTYCPKSFTMRNHLETHIRTHTGEKPYKCKECGKEYSDRPTFRRHLETHGDEIHKCSVCSKEFKVWHTYRTHMKVHKIHLKRQPQILDIAHSSDNAESTATVTVDKEEVQTNETNQQSSEACSSQMENSLSTEPSHTDNLAIDMVEMPKLEISSSMYY